MTEPCMHASPAMPPTVEHVQLMVRGVPLVQAVAQAVHEQPVRDLARLQVHARNALGLPDVGPQLAVNHLQLRVRTPWME